MPDRIERLNAALQGRYAIERKLGEGGMATVYLAHDVRHDRPVAIKVLKPELAAVIGAERFLAEIRTTANLQHPHILALFDSGEADGFLFYVMPFVDGETLRERLDRDRQLPVDDAMRIATTIAEALDYAHRQGVVHRDVKPANILLQDGRPVVSDFGIALAVSAGGGGRLTETGLSVGTPHYMSPEQATGDAHIGAATDIYALGCVLYEMLVGEPPYTGSSPQAILGKILQAEPASAREARRSVPQNVDAAIRRCLEKLPADRFISAQDFADALADASFRHGSEPEQALGATSRSWRTLALAMTILAIVASAVALWAINAGPQSREPIRFTESPPPGGRFVEAPVVSPDGRTLAMLVRDDAGETRIWVRPLDAEAARPLEGTGGAQAIIWSPAGDEIAFGTARELRRIRLNGSGEQLIAALQINEGVWAGDDLIVATANRIVRLPSTGGAPRTIVEGAQYRALDVVEGGRHLLVGQFGGETGIHAIDLGSGEGRVLLPGVPPIVRLVGTDLFVYWQGPRLLQAQRIDPETMEMLGEPFPVQQDVESFRGGASGALSFMSGSGEAGRLVWFDREGREIGEAEPEAQYSEVYISPDGARALYTRADPETNNRDLWIQPLNASVPPTRFTTDPDIDHLATFSADGRMVAWEAHQGGQLNLVRKAVDGTSAPELMRRWGRGGGTSHWSPDGADILYASQGSLWAIPVEGDAEPYVLVESEFTQPEGKFSPDGRWLAYSSDDTGQHEIYLTRLEGMRTAGAPIRVTDGGGRFPLWRADGRELFFVSGDQLMVVDARLDEDSPAGTPRVLFSLPATGQNRYAVTPDGQRILTIVPVDRTAGRSASVVLNWASGVEARR